MSFGSNVDSSPEEKSIGKVNSQSNEKNNMSNQTEMEKWMNPKRWKLLDKTANSQQLVFKLGHLNPEVFMDSEKGERNKILKTEVRGNITETTSTYGIITKKGKMADFYDSMAYAIQSGLITEFTIQDIQDLRDRANKGFPEECDYITSISAINYKEEKVASQAFINTATQFTKGLADTVIPGAPNNMTIGEAFKNPLVIAEMKKQGHSMERIDAVAEKIREASTQMTQSTQKINARFELGKFHQYPAVYFIPPERPETTKKEKKRNRTIEIENSDGTMTKIQASGGFDDRVEFPPNAFEKEEYPIGGKILQAVQAENFVISGGFLSSLFCAPSGKLFCQSLTQFKTVTKTTYSDGMTFIDHLIVLENSCLEKEGYMNREEIEKMILEFISTLR